MPAIRCENGKYKWGETGECKYDSVAEAEADNENYYRNVFVVTGSPCSGKNTYIQNNKREGDIVWDFDKIHSALTGEKSHIHIEAVRKYVFAMRSKFYDLVKNEKELRVWIINSSPYKEVRNQLAEELNAEIIYIKRSKEECLDVANNERPEEWKSYVNNYFERFEEIEDEENIKIIEVKTMKKINERHIKRVIEDEENITIVYGKSEDWEGVQIDTENEEEIVDDNLRSECDCGKYRDHTPGHEVEEEIDEEEEEELEEDQPTAYSRSNNIEHEKRFFDVETRIDSSNGKDVVVGHAAVFNSLSSDLGNFKEMIMPGAFDDVLENDTRAYFNHNPDYLLGRVSAGTLRLSVDEKGLRYELDIPKTTAGRDLKENLRNGNITQSSFAFTLPSDGDSWERMEDGTDLRKIHKIAQLWDVSPVSVPAYPEASNLALANRSLEKHKENERITKEDNFGLNTLNLKINLLKIKK
jgi:HK97 family phage prohead protease